MKKRSRNIKKEYMLDGAGIEGASELISETLRKWKVERQNCLRIRLSLEENLLRYRDHFGESVPFVLTISRRFHRLLLQIELKGEIYNPLSKTEHEMQDWSSVLVTSIGLAPRFNYTGNTNILRLTIQRKGMNPVLRLLIALIAGVLLGTILFATISQDNASLIVDTIESPVTSFLLQVLNLMSGPVIFFMVLSTVTGFSQMTGTGASYLKMLFRFLLISILISVFAAVVTIGICGIGVTTDVIDNSTVRSILYYIISFLPEDVFAAVRDANTPQLMVVAFVIGAAMNVLSERVTTLKKVVDQINSVGMHITEWVSNIIPFVVFVLIVLQIVEREEYNLIRLWFPLLISLGCVFILMTAAIIYTAVRKHVSPRKLIKKLWPPFIMALKTGSLSESFGLTEKSCRVGLGIDREFTMVSLSHGLILYMPGSIVSVVVFSIYTAAFSDNQLTYFWIIGLIILANTLSIAAPPVPGVDMLVYLTIFQELDISFLYIVPAIVFDIVFGILACAVNQMMLQIEMIHHADRVGLLKRNILLH